MAQQQTGSALNSDGSPKSFKADFLALWDSGHYEGKVGAGFGATIDVGPVASADLEASVTKTFGTTDGSTYNAGGAVGIGVLGFKAVGEAGTKFDSNYGKWTPYARAENQISIGASAFWYVGGGIKYTFGSQETHAVFGDIFKAISHVIPAWTKN